MLLCPKCGTENYDYHKCVECNYYFTQENMDSFVENYLIDDLNGWGDELIKGVYLKSNVISFIYYRDNKFHIHNGRSYGGAESSEISYKLAEQLVTEFKIKEEER